MQHHRSCDRHGTLGAGIHPIPAGLWSRNEGPDESAECTCPPDHHLCDGPTRIRSPEAAAVAAEIAAALKARFVRRPASESVELLRRAGIGAIVVKSFAEFKEEHTAIAPLSGETLVESPWPLIQREEGHPWGHVIDDVAPTGIRPQHMLIKAPRPAPKFGAQTREILSELGYAAEEIERLIQGGVAGERWSERYLPT
jgi:crotonobetainyl-CoA:carnitine CoA-transferase CaiB-like acyl-CoA transferase